MAFGQLCECSTCDFSFLSGHSHHEGNSQAFCRACFALFLLPTKSHWGPAIGELIELHRLQVTEMPGSSRKRKRPSVTQRLEPVGEYVLVERREGESWGVHYPMQDVRCPSCRELDQLTLDFESGEPCPVCKIGRLDCSPVDY